MKKLFDRENLNEVELLFYKCVITQLYLVVFVFGALVLLALSLRGIL